MVAQSLNTVSSALPPELLSAIFGNLDMSQRITASATCRYWREVLIASPVLWQNLSLRESEILPVFLARSANAPVDLTVTTTGRHSGELSAALHQHAWHLRRIHIKLGVGHDSRHITDVLTLPSPTVKSFVLEKQSPQPMWPIPVDLFGGQSPRLEHMILRGVPLEQPLNCMSHVKTLVMIAAPVRQELMNQLLWALQNLEVFVIAIDNGPDVRNHHRQTLPVSHPPKLRTLGIHLRVPGGPHDGLLDGIHPNAITNIDVRTIRSVVPIQSPERFTSLWASASTTTNQHHNLHVAMGNRHGETSLSGLQRVHRRLDLDGYDALVQLARPVISLAPLRELTLAVWLLCGHVPLLSSPHAPVTIPTLETLTILVSPRGVFFGKMPTGRLVESIQLWRYPALRVLRFARDPQSSAGLTSTRSVSIPPESIIEFLREERARGMPKLEQLVLFEIWSGLEAKDIHDFASELIREDAWEPDILKMDECDQWLCKQ